jgi:rfaE bifunctional protein nucleotidyltransferase chain/domain/rfaE bifunctional protein kinase chain/domain
MSVVVVVGDAVVDVDVTGQVERVGPEGCLVLEAETERRRPGAAALAAIFAAADGADVRLVTALAVDEPAHWLRRTLREAGIELVDVGLAGPTPQKWRLRSTDGTLLRVDRDCSPSPVLAAPIERVHTALASADAVLVSDYGRGVAGTLQHAIRSAVRDRPVVWDPHPRGPKPPPGLDLVTPNEREAAALVRAAASGDRSELARRLVARLESAVALTCGGDGAVLAEPGQPAVEIPTTATHGDTCGAGDRMAARTTVDRAAGAGRRDAVAAGVAAATRYVETGRFEPLDSEGADGFELAASVRRRGGVVVAAGGCFDLLHAGHIQLLQAARALGDCLIVCLNGDRSVRRLKGAGRPVVGERDRRRVVEALACVDAVVTFDEDTPARVLERLRPHVFAKGADYAEEDLPERAVLERWGGRVAILPLSDGRSTSRLIELARAEAS